MPGLLTVEGRGYVDVSTMFVEEGREKNELYVGNGNVGPGVGLEVSLRFGAVRFPYLAGTYPKGPT